MPFARSRRLPMAGGERIIGVNRHRNGLSTNPSKVWDRYAGCLVTAGSGTYTDAAGRCWRVEPGMVVHHFPALFHHIERDPGGWEEYSLLFDTQTYRHLRDLGLVDEAVPVARISGLRAAREGFQRLHRALASAEDPAALVLQAAGLLAALRPVAEPPPADPLTAAIAAAGDELARDLAAEVPLAAFARRAGVSYAHFRRCFRTHIGQSPGAFRTAARLEHARLLLRQHPLTVTEVARRCGYADAFIFSRQYARRFGIAPSRDQARHLQR